MIEISNTDFLKAIRLLASYSSMRGNNLREEERMRQARLLVRKWERKLDSAKKAPESAEKINNNKTLI